MKVLKFGGTSVGSAQRMKEVSQLILNGEKNLVVLSAMSGTTNTLVEISDYLYKKNTDGANETINKLELKYARVVEELYSTDEYKAKTSDVLKSIFNYIRSFTKELFTLFEEKIILAQGELMTGNWTRGSGFAYDSSMPCCCFENGQSPMPTEKPQPCNFGK